MAGSASAAAPERDVLLATKLHMPASRPDLVSRPRLADRLDEGLARGLVLVCASAGYGKTVLVEHRPAGVGVVLASRSDPPLGLARLRARGQLTEIREAELRFTPAEAAELLQHAAWALPDASVAALAARTEGWAAGLQLAALSLRGHEDAAASWPRSPAATGTSWTTWPRRCSSSRMSSCAARSCTATPRPGTPSTGWPKTPSATRLPPGRCSGPPGSSSSTSTWSTASEARRPPSTAGCRSSPPSVVRSRPRLLLAQAHMAADSGDLEVMEPLLDAVECAPPRLGR